MTNLRACEAFGGIADHPCRLPADGFLVTWEFQPYKLLRVLPETRLHYVFDLWVEVWRKKVAKGDVIVVRYADDLVLGFQYRTDAERFLQAFRERLAKFGLELHADKTRLIEFGRFAARNRKQRGEGKPETFTFLGFTRAQSSSMPRGIPVDDLDTAPSVTEIIGPIGEMFYHLGHHEIVDNVGVDRLAPRP